MYIDDINKRLKAKYGYDLLDNPMFRVVWSDAQIETRKGEFEKWYGHIYCGVENTVKTLPKYNYISERWVLERLFANNEEVTGIIGNTTYEPLYVFEDKNGNYLEPNLRAADLICWMSLNPRRQARDFEDQARKQLEDEINYFEEYINNETPYLATMLSNREAVVVP